MRNKECICDYNIVRYNFDKACQAKKHHCTCYEICDQEVQGEIMCKSAKKHDCICSFIQIYDYEEGEQVICKAREHSCICDIECKKHDCKAIFHDGNIRLQLKQVGKKKKQKCMICYTKTFFYTMCNHPICWSCERDLLNHFMFSCPMCRQKLQCKQYVKDYLFVFYDFLTYDGYYRLKYEYGDDVDEHIKFIRLRLMERLYQSLETKIDYDISNLFM